MTKAEMIWSCLAETLFEDELAIEVVAARVKIRKAYYENTMTMGFAESSKKARIDWLEATFPELRQSL